MVGHDNISNGKVDFRIERQRPNILHAIQRQHPLVNNRALSGPSDDNNIHVETVFKTVCSTDVG